MRLWEFYVVDVNSTLESFDKAFDRHQAIDPNQTAWAVPSQDAVVILRDPSYGRFSRRVDMDRTVGSFFLAPVGNEQHPVRKARCRALLKKRLDAKNLEFYREFDEVLVSENES